MTEYRVVWEIDLDADSPREAAEEALRIQRDPDSIATVFQVGVPGDVDSELAEPVGRPRTEFIGHWWEFDLEDEEERCTSSRIPVVQCAGGTTRPNRCQTGR